MGTIKITIDWLGTQHMLDGASVALENIKQPAYLREWTEAEYAAVGGSSAVRRKFLCRCNAIQVQLPDGSRLDADHAEARWDGDAESGYILTVSRIADSPFLGGD